MVSGKYGRTKCMMLNSLLQSKSQVPEFLYTNSAEGNSTFGLIRMVDTIVTVRRACKHMIYTTASLLHYSLSNCDYYYKQNTAGSHWVAQDWEYAKKASFQTITITFLNALYLSMLLLNSSFLMHAWHIHVCFTVTSLLFVPNLVYHLLVA